MPPGDAGKADLNHLSAYFLERSRHEIQAVKDVLHSLLGSQDCTRCHAACWTLRFIVRLAVGVGITIKSCSLRFPTNTWNRRSFD